MQSKGNNSLFNVVFSWIPLQKSQTIEDAYMLVTHKNKSYNSSTTSK